MRKTKIVATLGPSSNDVEQLKALIEAGIGAARLNFSHGDHEEHGARINNFKQAREELGKPVSFLIQRVLKSELRLLLQRRFLLLQVRNSLLQLMISKAITQRLL